MIGNDLLEYYMDKVLNLSYYQKYICRIFYNNINKNKRVYHHYVAPRGGRGLSIPIIITDEFNFKMIEDPKYYIEYSISKYPKYPRLKPLEIEIPKVSIKSHKYNNSKNKKRRY